jgi:3-keto-disaccharide hydrolase
MSKQLGLVTALTVAVSMGLALPVPSGGKQTDKGSNGELKLFNGKNLNGWDTWLGKPHKGDKVVGLNNDPKKVFSVVTFEGQPAIRISGEIFGALTTKEEYENYSIRLEFKWGKQKWPPREAAARDSGLLYHCTGPHGAAGTFWMQSLECQIQETDCGDFWSVGGVVVDVRASPIWPKKFFSAIRYDPKGTIYTVPRRLEEDEDVRIDPLVVKRGGINDFNSEWNTIEVQTVGTTSVHIVNGKVNMVLTNARHLVKGSQVALKRGKIQIQSEGAEVYYRNISLRPITGITAARKD